MAKGRKTWWRRWGRRSKKSLDGVEQLADVGNLYRDLGLEPSTYQRFDEPPPAPTALVDESRAEEFIAPAHLAPRTQPVATEASQLREPPAAVVPEPEPPVAKPFMETPLVPGGMEDFKQEFGGSRPEARFSLLQRLGDDAEQHAPELAPVIGLASYTGGVGKSTLTAALGAAFARLNRRCVLVGQTPYSPLAYYFGGPEVVASGNQAAIVHYSQAIEGGGKPVDLLIGDVSTDELLENVRRRIPQASIVVMDMEASPNVGNDLPFFDMTIVPVRPDINALVVIDRIERALEASTRPPAFGTWYLLNQFDAGRELHVQVHETLRRRLGSRLLPFTLPLDNSVQEALASGQPPQVYKAYTPFARAVNEFEAWLDERIQSPVKRSVAEEG